MRPHLTLFAAILVVPALTGCKQSVKQRLQGRWVGEQAINFPANQTRSAGGWARGASFEFQGNRVTVSIPAESPRQGTFKVTELTKDELRVAFMRPSGAVDPVNLRLDGERRLHWSLGGGRSIVMRKIAD